MSNHGMMDTVKRPAAKRDFMQVTRSIVEQVAGEQMDGNTLLEPPKDERNPHAVAPGNMGRKKGGKAKAKARTKSLNSKRRSAIARKASKSRWGNK